MPAIIIVPASGKDKGPFLECAKAVLNACYRNDGMIFKASSRKGTNGVVDFLSASTPPRGVSPDYLEAMRRASDYIVISHMGAVDG
jgi:hypothetical protein